MKNPYTATKQALGQYFRFLEAAGFPGFEEEQRAYEYHFLTRNVDVCIDIYIELISTTPVWVSINGYFIEDLEPDNEVLHRNPIIIADYLQEVSAILQRHPAVLKGELDSMIKNEALRLRERENKAAAARIEKGIYTVEYSVFSNDDYHAYEEFDDLDKMRQFISGLQPDGIYRVLNPYMEEISL
ncbi:hypothetical protein [Chitinophaga sp.]|uniref:hypothetical protein n=1 Tax=Chitinophaga sp. TaxID=1869181 RepID=UPI0031E2CCA2